MPGSDHHIAVVEHLLYSPQVIHGPSCVEGGPFQDVDKFGRGDPYIIAVDYFCLHAYDKICSTILPN